MTGSDRPARPKIVVGVDFSDCSRDAAKAAGSLALDMRMDIVLVHAFEEMPAGAMVGELYGDSFKEIRGDKAVDEAITLSTEWAKELRAKGLQVETVVEEDEPSSLIVATAKEVGAAFIVVGTHGRGPVARFFAGSVAADVVRKAGRPVLVVPERD